MNACGDCASPSSLEINRFGTEFFHLFIYFLVKFSINSVSCSKFVVAFSVFS